MTALAGIAALLAALIAGIHRLPATRRPPVIDGAAAGLRNLSPRPPLQVDQQQAIDDYFREHVPFVGPVPLGAPLAVSGDAGLSALLWADRNDDAASYTVRVQNIGTRSFDGSFSSGGAWLDTDLGRFYPPEIRILPTGTASPSAIGPGAEADLVLTFRIPPRARPVKLVLSLGLGHYYPNAQWTLTP